MSFHQKSAWACLLSTALIWGGYFVLVFASPALGLAVPAGLGAVALQVVVMIASHVIFRWVDRDGGRSDERDRAIAVRSGYWAGLVLSVGVMCCVVLFPMREVALHMDPAGWLASGALAGPFTTGVILLLWFVLSEIVHYSAQLVLYSRG